MALTLETQDVVALNSFRRATSTSRAITRLLKRLEDDARAVHESAVPASEFNRGVLQGIAAVKHLLTEQPLTR